METVEIAKSEYDELRARPERRDLDAAIERAEKAEKDLEAAETAKVKAENEKAGLQKKVDQAEEQARQSQLRDERMDALGAGFVGALGDRTKERLRRQAGELADAEWTARLEELEELTGRQRGDGEENGRREGDTTFSADEVARFQGGSRSSESDVPTPNQRRSVFAGLSKSR